ncbi:fragment of putative 2-hydroxychromene-2-carboxylate isomerase protein (part 2) [Ralstonia solanacearum K60]|nr:fragment of putative 2-hydroxychromene-2-carboxylate isomerase protein (part 2) [Ralstonia solanacearum K60]
MSRGVFGSPYVIVDGEPFWGFDQIEALLRDGRV